MQPEEKDKNLSQPSNITNSWFVYKKNEIKERERLWTEDQVVATAAAG